MKGFGIFLVWVGIIGGIVGLLFTGGFSLFLGLVIAALGAIIVSLNKKQ